MRFSNRQTLITFWIGLAMVVPSMCLLHALPHAHADETHPHSEPLPAPAATHGHAHHHDADHEHAVPEEPHHHHILDDHFESDPVRLQKRAQDPDTGPTDLGAVVVDAPADTRDASAAFTGQEPVPIATPSVAGAPRAPPLHG